MSRKHYSALAERFRNAFARCTTDGERRAVALCVSAAADVAAMANPAFDRARFMEACAS